MKAYKNFIFDIDDTIIESEDISTNSLRDSLKIALDIELTEEELGWHFGIPTDAFYEKIGFTKEQADKLNEVWGPMFKEYNKDTKMYDDMDEVLLFLKDNGYILGIVTARCNDEMKTLGLFEVNKYFDSDKIVTCDLVEKPKPSGEAILKIINEFNLNKEETIYIGDTEHDSAAAFDAGVDFGLALWGTNDSSIKATIKLKEPKEVLELIKKD